MGPGPVTGSLDRPSQEASENRKASIRERTRPTSLNSARLAIASLLEVEMKLLVAAQRAARSQIFASIDAACADLHTARTTAVLSRFAARRAAVAQSGNPAQQKAALDRIAIEETTELAALALELAAQKRRRRNETIAPLLPIQRDARLALRRAHRRQRAVAAIRLRSPAPRVRTSDAALPRSRPRARIQRPTIAARFNR